LSKDGKYIIERKSIKEAPKEAFLYYLGAKKAAANKDKGEKRRGGATNYFDTSIKDIFCNELPFDIARDPYGSQKPPDFINQNSTLVRMGLLEIEVKSTTGNCFKCNDSYIEEPVLYIFYKKFSTRRLSRPRTDQLIITFGSYLPHTEKENMLTIKSYVEKLTKLKKEYKERLKDLVFTNTRKNYDIPCKAIFGPFGEESGFFNEGIFYVDDMDGIIRL